MISTTNYFWFVTGVRSSCTGLRCFLTLRLHLGLACLAMLRRSCSPLRVRHSRSSCSSVLWCSVTVTGSQHILISSIHLFRFHVFTGRIINHLSLYSSVFTFILTGCLSATRDLISIFTSALGRILCVCECGGKEYGAPSANLIFS